MSSIAAIPYPAVLRAGYELRVIDYAELELAGDAAADGTAVLSSDYVQQGYLLRAERICVTGTSSRLTQITVLVGDDTSRPARYRDGTPFPPGQVAVSEYPSFLTVLPTLCLTLLIDGASPGDSFGATVQYQLVQKVLIRRP